MRTHTYWKTYEEYCTFHGTSHFLTDGIVTINLTLTLIPPLPAISSNSSK